MARTKPKGRARDRILSDDEIRALYQAATQVEPRAFGVLVRFLLLTGQRRDEAARATWIELLGDPWIIPRGRYKTNTEHVVPLSVTARRLLEELREMGPYPFTTRGTVPISGFSKFKRKLDLLMRAELKRIAIERGEDPADIILPPWTLHDLRRTARSIMSRAGVSSEIGERVIGHAQGGVNAVYDRYSYTVEKRQALEALAGQVARILSDPLSNVVSFARTGLR
jgi:integrase